MKNFKILMDSDAKALEQDVNEHLKRGWLLHEGLQIVSSPKLGTQNKGGRGGLGILGGIGGKGGDVTVSKETFFVQAVVKK